MKIPYSTPLFNGLQVVRFDPYCPTRSSFPVSELPATKQPVEEPGTELALTVVLADAWAPPCTTSFRLSTGRQSQVAYGGAASQSWELLFGEAGLYSRHTNVRYRAPDVSDASHI